MKTYLKWFAIVALLMFLAMLAEKVARADEPGGFYQAGEFGISLGADVSSSDLENGRLGYSGALRYYLTDNWGIGAAATSQRLDNDYRVAALALFRIPFKRAALLTEAGGEFDIENETWALRLSVGPGFRWTKNIETSLTVGARKFFGHGAQGQTIESLVTAQTTIYFGGK